MVNPAFNRAREKRRYWQVRPGPGFSWATCETEAEARDYGSNGGEPGIEYELREVWMTVEKFESMPEHDGW